MSRVSTKVSSSSNASVGGSNSGGSSSAAPVAATSSSKRYKFHADYTKNADGEGGGQRKGTRHVGTRHAKRHPLEDDDEFWAKKYKMVNYRKMYPQDYDENLFQTLYDWLTNGNKNDTLDGEAILFDKEEDKRQRKARTPEPSKEDRRLVLKLDARRRSKSTEALSSATVRNKNKTSSSNLAKQLSNVHLNRNNY